MFFFLATRYGLVISDEGACDPSIPPFLMRIVQHREYCYGRGIIQEPNRLVLQYSYWEREKISRRQGIFTRISVPLQQNFSLLLLRYLRAINQTVKAEFISSYPEGIQISLVYLIKNECQTTLIHDQELSSGIATVLTYLVELEPHRRTTGFIQYQRIASDVHYCFESNQEKLVSIVKNIDMNYPTAK